MQLLCGFPEQEEGDCVFWKHFSGGKVNYHSLQVILLIIEKPVKLISAPYYAL